MLNSKLLVTTIDDITNKIVSRTNQDRKSTRILLLENSFIINWNNDIIRFHFLSPEFLSSSISFIFPTSFTNDLKYSFLKFLISTFSEF